MRPRSLFLILAAVLAGSMLTAGSVQAASFRVLLFTKTASAATAHASTPDAVNAITGLGASNDFEVVHSTNSAVFTTANLATYQVVMFVNTHGDVLDPSQQLAMEGFIEDGGGFVGVHSAAETELTWSWYQALVGATYLSRPATVPQAATVKVLDQAHVSTAGFPSRWIRSDEWYNWKVNPRGKVHVLATVDEKTYSGGTGGSDHPIAWCQGYEGGRSWYTAGGHTSASWAETLFRNHVLGGIKYAASGDTKRDCGATIQSNVDRVTLDDRIDQPMSLDIAPDGRVFFVERTGKVKIFKPTGPSTGTTVLAATINTSYDYDHGLQGIALDPAFATNKIVYLFYTAKPANVGDLEMNRLSRFTVVGDSLDLSSEKILLTYGIANSCCHQGGSLAFDPFGNLYLSTGDDSDAAENGYAPIDESPMGARNDAQRSAGNTKDLRGKILRIKPDASAASGYTIPSGNLFASASDGLPEIYIMGSRNPFRISVGQDPARPWLYWGDVGPDAYEDDSTRGPKGHDEINQARQAGNFGWPHCLADNKQYVDKTTKVPFDCTGGPLNDSPRNTGLQILPPAQKSLIWYPYVRSSLFPELGEDPCRTAAAGPVYQHDPLLTSDRQFPEYYDGSLFIYDWCRSWIKEVKLDEEGNVLKINPFLANQPFDSPIDMEQGPDGALYVLDFGKYNDPTSYFATPNSGYLTRVDYSINGRTPIAKADKSAPTAGTAPLTVTFSSEGSYDPDTEDVVSFEWDFEDDGVVDSTSPNTTHTYPAGNFTAKLTVKDQTGKFAVTRLPIASGNLPATITMTPTDGEVHRLGEKISYVISVTDEEDGSTEDPVTGQAMCNRVQVSVDLGHTNHVHPERVYQGCRGEIDAADMSGHEGAYLFRVLTASYTDNGAPGVASHTTQRSSVLQPDRMQAEHFTSSLGVTISPSNDPKGGGQSLTQINHDDWISFSHFNLKGVHSIGFRVSSSYAGGRIEVRSGSRTGAILAVAVIPHTAHNTIYVDVLTPVIGQSTGAVDLYLVFQRHAGAIATGNPSLGPGGQRVDIDGVAGLFNLNWVDFHTGRPPNIATVSS